MKSDIKVKRGTLVKLRMLDNVTAGAAAQQSELARLPPLTQARQENLMAMQVTCPLCGVTIKGDDEEALVAAADAHGDESHGMRAPREMILSNATEA
jgi:hypothetical protein